MKDQIGQVIQSFGLKSQDFSIERINSGHINYTYKLSCEKSYILQRVNKDVFTNPKWIAHNHRLAQSHLERYHPDYLFLDTIKTLKGDDLIFDEFGFPWRLFPFVDGSVTIDEVTNINQAFNAAAAFGALSKNLSNCNPSEFKTIIPKFHDLAFRFNQFEEALNNCGAARRGSAEISIMKCKEHYHLVEAYNGLIESGKMKLGITHNDTKINNVLFSKGTDDVICVIDLDTLMPGYFIYDVGDMIRTFVSPVSEEEKDFAKIEVREEVKEAVLEGYLSEMNTVLSKVEREALSIAGPIMTYIIGMRFLTDYLNGDTYYQISYSNQNLIRANNQFTLLEKLLK